MREIIVKSKVPVRINVYLRNEGVGSRRAIDDYINKISDLSGNSELENEKEKNKNKKNSAPNEASIATGGSVSSISSGAATNKLSNLKSSLSSLRINVLDLKPPTFLKLLGMCTSMMKTV